jgi:iron complex transport system ATP-binding protein
MFTETMAFKRNDDPDILALDRVTLIRDGKKILDDVSFRVRPGEHWAVLGANGAGKSFLLRLLGGEHFPTSGTIDVLGRRFGEVDLWELKVRLGFVSDLLQARYRPQSRGEDIVLSGFFASNGLYDRVTPLMKKKACVWSDRLGIRHLFPRRFDELSHGEQRKLLIARALVLDPAILILDEPCTGLDLAAREDFLSALSAVARSGVSLLIVTHHLEEIIPEVNRVLLLRQGRVTGAGPKKDLLTASRLGRLFDHPVSLRIVSGRYQVRARVARTAPPL